jgi:hypothetical protein
MRTLSLTWAFAFTLTATGALAQTLGVETRIDLGFDETDIRVRPDPAPGFVHHEVHLILSQGNKVTEVRRATAADGRTGNDQFEGTLGGGGGGRVVWRVMSKNTLVRVQDWPQSTLTMTVSTSGSNSCRLDVVAKLKPGFSEYEIFSIHKKVMAYYSKWDTSNPTCVIH